MLPKELAVVRRSVDPLSEQLSGLHAGIERLEAGLAGVADVVEPLQSTANRVARLSNRLPGS